MPVFQKLNSGLQTYNVCSPWIRFTHDDPSVFWQTPKTLTACLSRFPDKTQRIISDAIFTALYICTQKLIHTKCPTLLKGTFRNAVIRGPVVEYSQRTPCLLFLISGLSSGWVSVWWREMGREMSGAAEVVLGTGASRDWTLSSGVTRRADPRAHQECRRLISCKGALERKANVSVGRDRRVLQGDVSSSLWLADLKPRCRYPSGSDCHGGCDLRLVSLFSSLHLPFY